MKQHSSLISALIIVVIIAFVVFDIFAPKKIGIPQDSEPTATSSTTDKSVTGSVSASTVSVKESSPSTPTIDVEFPQFTGLPADFNETIGASVSGRLADFREIIMENDIARKTTSASGGAAIPLSAFSFNASWKPGRVDDRYVSIVVRYDSYAGGANENQELETFNYDVAAKKTLVLSDLFPGTTDYLVQISTLARADLKAKLEQASNGSILPEMFDAGTVAIDENYHNFTFTDNTVTIYFPKYSVAPGAFGEQKVVIQRDAVK
ncbi:MAG: DUF3298 domain-containing protein [Candidatus Paceibacterota bacterium]